MFRKNFRSLKLITDAFVSGMLRNGEDVNIMRNGEDVNIMRCLKEVNNKWETLMFDKAKPPCEFGSDELQLII